MFELIELLLIYIAIGFLIAIIMGVRDRENIFDVIRNYFWDTLEYIRNIAPIALFFVILALLFGAIDR